MKGFLRIARRLSILALFGGASLAWGIDNREVLTLLEAGLSEETILLAIRHAEEADFAAEAKDLTRLKEAGASEAILQAVILRAAGHAPAPAPAPVPTLAPSPRPAPQARFDTVADEAALLPPAIAPQIGERYRTRFTLQYEGDEWPATNYGRGVFLPINSEVELIGMSGDFVRLRLPSGEVVAFKNIPKYTGADLATFAGTLLAAEPTPIERYGEEVAGYIRRGEPRLGMTKQQVLLTRGYPPRHETPFLERDRWVYWSSRFVKHTFAFQEGRLVEARGVH